LTFAAGAIAHSLNLCRLLARIGNGSPPKFHQRPVKVRGRLIKLAPYHWLFLAERELMSRLFCSILRSIEARPSRVEEETAKAKQISLTRENVRKENGPRNQTEKRRFRTLRRRPRRT
jgi:hypothetical protein